MKTGICLTVKNEAPYLAEWIVYHHSLGFDNIWIYDNNSQDRIVEALHPFLNCVERINWPQIPAFPSNVKDCLLRAQSRSVDWLALIDADEFIVPVSADPLSLRKILRKAEENQFDEIRMPMYFYSSSGHVLIPPGRVVDNYRIDTAKGGFKAMVRVSSNPTPHSTHGFKCARFQNVSCLRINHYRNKSKEDDLIRRGKGFVDKWGWKNFAPRGVLDQKWAEYEICKKGFPTGNNAAVKLSAQFNTPGTQADLAAEPIKIVIFDRNRRNGQKLKERLGSEFRDIVLWSSGGEIRNPSAPAQLSNDGFAARMNRAHELSNNAPVLWTIPSDVALLNSPKSYKEAIVSSYSFGLWSPKLLGRRRANQGVPNGKLCRVQFVQSIAWAVSRDAREIGFPLPEGSYLGWGHDLILSRRCMEAGLQNFIDARVSLIHVPDRNILRSDPKQAMRQMMTLLKGAFPDGNTFGSPTYKKDEKNVISDESNAK